MFGVIQKSQATNETRGKHVVSAIRPNSFEIANNCRHRNNICVRGLAMNCLKAHRFIYVINITSFINFLIVAI